MSTKEFDVWANYRRHLRVTVNNHPALALADSGNSYRVLVSHEFYLNLGYHLDKLKPTKEKIYTAKAKKTLEILGEPPTALTLRIPSINFTAPIHPLVIKNLGCEINLSGPFLKQYNISQVHAEDALYVGDQKVPLEPPGGQEITATRLETAKAHRIPAWSMAVLTLKAPGVENKLMPPGDGMATLDEFKLLDWGLQSDMDIITHCNREGLCKVTVANYQDGAVILPAGKDLGSFTLTCAEQDWGRTPWRVCSLNPASELLKIKHNKTDETADASADYPSANLKTVEEKKKFITSFFKLDNNPLLTKSADRDRLVQLLVDYWDIFSHQGECGRTNLLEHNIVLLNETPIRTKYRPINPALEPQLREQLDLWLRDKIIEPSESPWSFQLVAVRKKNGKIRWAVDYRRLNSVTVFDAYPIPSVETTLARLAGSTLFSSLDLSSAFNAVPLTPASRPKTSFATPYGSFQYKNMPFGIKNGPSVFSRLVDLILLNVPKKCAVSFFDDILPHSVNDVPTHTNHLEEVFKAIRKSGMRVALKKVELMKTSIKFLGHEVGAFGIRPLKSYTEAIAKWELPKLKSQARAFIGLVSYYRSHIPNFAHWAKPWTDVVGKTSKEAEKTKLVVTPEMIKSFNFLRKALISQPVLGMPILDGKPEHQFILDTDFSRWQVSGILSQRQKGGERRSKNENEDPLQKNPKAPSALPEEVVIAYGSKKLNKAQQNYHSHKGEVYAVVFWIQRWAFYLQHNHFLLRVDNAAISHLKTMENRPAVMDRWLDILNSFSFDIEHRAGKKHVNADTLSRFGPGEEADKEGEEPFKQVASLSLETFGGEQQLKRLQEEDGDLKLVRKWVEEKQKPTKYEQKSLSPCAFQYSNILDSLLLDGEGILRYKRPVHAYKEGTKHVPCLPFALWKSTLQKGHETAGHAGREKTLSILTKAVFFPGLPREVAMLCKTCEDCQMKKRDQKDQRHTHLPVTAAYAFQKTCVDFFGPLPKSKNGNKWILTMRDVFTRWVEAYALPSATAEDAATAVNDFVCRFGPMEVLHTDRAKAFLSNTFKNFCKLWGVKLTHTTGYHPSGNSPVERVHKDMGAMMRAMLKKDPADWEQKLPLILHAIRTTNCSSTGMTPYSLVFGREASSTLDFLFHNKNEAANFQGDPTKPLKYYEQLRKNIILANEYARKNMKSAIQRTRRAYHDQRNEMKTGQRVWLYTPRSEGKGVPKKLQRWWTGPYKILEGRINDTTLRIKADGKWSTGKEEPLAVSIDRLKVFHFDDREQAPVRKDLCCKDDPHCEAFDLPSDDDSSDDSPDERSDEEMDAAVDGAVEALADEQQERAQEEARRAAEEEARAPEPEQEGGGAMALEGGRRGEDEEEQGKLKLTPRTGLLSDLYARRFEGIPPSTPPRDDDSSTPKTGTKKKRRSEAAFHTPSTSLATRTRSSATRKTTLPLKFKDFEMETMAEEEEKEEKERAKKTGAKRKK